MKFHGLLTTAALGVCLLTSAAWAQSSSDARLEALERRIQQLEKRLAERDAAVVEKERALAKLQAQVAVQEQTAADLSTRVEEEAGGGWANSLEIGGAVEVVIVHDSPYEGEATADNALDTAEVGLAAQISDAVSAELVLAMDDDGKMEVDTASFTLAVDEAPVSLTAGQITLPFADFGTELVSDPMALEVGEVGASALQLGFESHGLAASVYVFNGEVDYDKADRISDFGAQVDYEVELDGIGVHVGVGWLGDLREGAAYGLEDGVDADRVAGLAVAGGVSLGPWSFSGHYMTARDELSELSVAGEPAQPSAYGVEAAYGFSLGDRDATVALGWQRTREALALEMPESRILAGISTELVEGVGIALEYAHHSDYDEMTCTATDESGAEQSVACGGSGEDGQTISLLLSAEF